MGRWDNLDFETVVISWVARIDTKSRRFGDFLDRHRTVILVLFSFAYFLTTCYRASRKSFWSDELYTLYVSRLPDIVSGWKALTSGVDFNPPLFYLLTRLAETPFGEGHVATRLPSILGLWILCLCLFWFVSLRTSAMAGFISMLFPLVTNAYYYGYEARPHGVVLGFCGIALVCWQAALHRSCRFWCLLGMGVALSSALLTHSYGVLVFFPLAAGELARTIRFRRVDWSVWRVFLMASVAVLVSIPLFRAVKVHVGNGLVPGFDLLWQSYYVHFGPAVVVLGLLVICLGIAESIYRSEPQPNGWNHFEPEELVAILAFACLPVLAFLLARTVKGPLLDRYTISCVVGLAALVGSLAARRAAVGPVVLLLLCGQIAVDFRKFVRSATLIEPSTGAFAPGHPLAVPTARQPFTDAYEWIDSVPDKTLPLVLLDPWEFLPIAYYSPPQLTSRLVYLSGPDYNGENYRKLRECCQPKAKVTLRSEFLRSHKKFLAYGGPRTSWQLQSFVDEAAVVSVVKTSSDYFLVLVDFGQTGR